MIQRRKNEEQRQLERQLDRDARQARRLRELQEAAEQREQDHQSDRETLIRKRHECNEALAENNLNYDLLFVENPLIKAGKEMYKVFEDQE